ncbi:MAG: flagellar filament capping protein FliD [Lachnospiraceae bacterium]|nr:flagellar filament capping protein FliD [Lachnospiraceae bacterium]
MSSINSIWGNNYSNNSSFFFGTTSSGSASGNFLGIDLAEYSSITKGSYKKLLKAYYAKYGTEKKTEESEKKTDSTTTKNTLKSNANELYKAAGVLTATGKKSVFNKVEVKDEETGAITKEYDKDKIYKAVNSFVDSYNNYIKKAADSKDNAVLRQTLRMVNANAKNSSLLADIGIKINADNTLSLDEEAFKEADMATVQSLFNGSDSWAGRIQSAASNVYTKVNDSMGDSNFYTSSGTLGKYSSGNILDSFL